jgi:positive regulator of sigma E activity
MKIPAILGCIKTGNAVVTKIAERGIYCSLNTSCNERAGCQTCTTCFPQKTKRMLFCPVPDPNTYTIGQCIKISYPALHEVIAAGIVFGLPLLCAVTTALLWQSCFSTTSDSPGAIFATVSALAAGFFFVFIIEKLIRAFFPIIIITKNQQL